MLQPPFWINCQVRPELPFCPHLQGGSPCFTLGFWLCLVSNCSRLAYLLLCTFVDRAAALVLYCGSEPFWSEILVPGSCLLLGTSLRGGERGCSWLFFSAAVALNGKILISINFNFLVIGWQFREWCLEHKRLTSLYFRSEGI